MSTLLSRESLIVHHFIFIKCSKTKNTMQNNECDQCRDTGTASGGCFLHRCVPRPWLILVSDPNTTDTTQRLKTKLSGEWNRTWSRGPRSHDLHEHHLLAVTNIASCPQPHVHRTLQNIVIIIQHWWFYTSVCITPVTQEQCSDSGWNKDWCVCVCVCVCRFHFIQHASFTATLSPMLANTHIDTLMEALEQLRAHILSKDIWCADWREPGIDPPFCSVDDLLYVLSYSHPVAVCKCVCVCVFCDCLLSFRLTSACAFQCWWSFSRCAA